MDEKLKNDIFTIAYGCGDREIEKKLDVLGVNNKIYYHNICKKTYLKKTIFDKRTLDTDWHKKQEFHKLTYADICGFVEKNIINNKECHLLQFLTDCYNEILEKLYVEEFKCFDVRYTSQHLLEKLQKTFGYRIQVIFMHQKKVIAPRDGGIINDETLYQSHDFELLSRAALMLRKKILLIAKKPLPTNLKVSDIIAGECEIPKDLSDFLRNLLCGIDSRTQKSSDCARKIDSISQDIIYAVHHGKMKTSKHITLGMTLKSITSSRKVVDLMNKFGHCCSYNVVEELETEVTSSACNAFNVSPEDAILAPNYCTGVAFDNFDRFVETTSGKDTLHDTVGIFYQNISDIDSSVSSESRDSTNDSQYQSAAKRRRTLDPIVPALQQYTKKLVFREKLLPIDNVLRIVSSDKYDFYKQLDIAWVLSHYCKVLNTPMWVGFCHKISNDNSVKQKISYLTPINASPTNPSVVYETMRQSQLIAKECQQTYMQVTYDLQITKVAYQIQSVEKPNFDDLFIHMGAFHTMMAYFKALGKFIDDCGLTHMMVESNLLASGSVNGFIIGKHFNRCKRLHPLVSLGLQVLHIEQFLKINKITISEHVIDFLKEIQSKNVCTDKITDAELLAVIKKYLEFKQDTLDGIHGKTAQYYVMYIEFVNYYLMFTRSIRVGDFDLYKFIIPKLCSLFFMFNQHNYARWLLKYYEDLLKVEEKFPQLAEEFKKGMFGIKRTNNSFSRAPVDLTLEQTVNADAARRLTGITHFTNSISARQRWARSHGIRSTIISHVFDISGLKPIQDATFSLEKHRITKDCTNLLEFINVLKNNVNPFDCVEINQDFLYNIKTGCCAPEAVAEFLLNAEKKGQQLRDTFISECSEDDRRFELVIKRNKIINFSTCNKRQKIIINHKVQEVRMQRDLFGRMLGISMEEATDIEKMFSFPMTPMPTSLCHLDGTICKTEKSAMMKILRNDSSLPAHIDVVIIDGFFLIHTLKDVPQSYGNISKKILKIITSYNAPCVHIVFDRYCSPSIKDYERSLRGGSESNQNYVISGPEQARTHDFAKDLRNDKFKEAFVLFLISHWQNKDVAPFIGNKTIILNFDHSYSYSVDTNGNVIRAGSLEFFCPSHEEADTKIIYHASKIDSDCTVVVKCSDTDIVVIMLGNLHKITAKIYIECGVSNSRHVIDVNALHEQLGVDVCKALPGFHAFTGCDYNPAFFRKGKQRPFKLLVKDKSYQKAFADLGNKSIDNDTFAKIESFVCNMYGFKVNKKVDNVRFQMFLRNYKVKNYDEAFLKKNVKNFDASCLPPSYSELVQQIRRAHYIAHLWNNSTLPNPIEFEPETSGWSMNENKYDFVWFEGPQLPSSVKDIIIDNEDSEGNSQFTTLYCIYDLFNLFNYLLFSADDEEDSEYDSDEDPASEENVPDTEYETD